MPSTRTHRRATVLALAVATAVTLGLVMPAGATAAPSPGGVPAGGRGAPRPPSPVVKHTGKGPTGYEVTFRYRDPAAASVQIKGEWYFERPSELAQLAGTPEAPVVETQGILPKNWKPGDVPIAHPNATAANWPVISMKKGRDGIWSYTTPLPAGVFTYQFFVNCTDPAQVGCTPVSDPGNPPWNQRNGVATGSTQATSQVFVPADSRVDASDLSWQGPARKQGRLENLTYSSPGHVAPANQNYLTVYTPPGYTPKRTSAYPTMYLLHGGGGNETDWSTQGALGDILDNLIAAGEIQPMVVVMPNNNGYPSSSNNQAFMQDLIDNMLPFIEGRFHVSDDPADRAFSGLSAGGIVTNNFMLYHPEVFDYYAMMSGGLSPANAVLTPAQIDGLQGKSIMIGSGWQDPIFAVGFRTNHTGPARQVATFAAAGLPVTTDFVHGGHNWHVWRILLRDFVTRVAFLPQPYLK